LGAGLVLVALALPAAGCSEQDMVTQAKYKPLQPSTLFDDGMSARPVVAGTVARGQVLYPAGDELRLHPAFETGEVGGKLVEYIPLSGFAPDVPGVSKPDPAAVREARTLALERGRERFNIFCTPCHDRTGRGNGIIVQRGFTKPPSFLEERLRQAPPGHFFKVMTSGYGAMYSYASRVPAADRWAIVTYIRALQLSQDSRPLHTGGAELSLTQQEGTAR
jgi:hypothetical protein